MNTENKITKIIVDDEIFLELNNINTAPIFFALQLKNYEEFSKWFPWTETTKNVEDQEKYLTECITEYEENKALSLGINYKGEWVGRIGLHTFSKYGKYADVWYWLNGSHEGMGIVSRSLQALIKFSFENFLLNKIKLDCASTNEKSKKVAERNEFKLEGVLREENVHPKLGARDKIVYGLLKNEFYSK